MGLVCMGMETCYNRAYCKHCFCLALQQLLTNKQINGKIYIVDNCVRRSVPGRLFFMRGTHERENKRTKESRHDL